MKNLKVSFKLFFGFGLAIVLSTAITIIAIVNFAGVANNVETFYENPFQEVQLSDEISKNFQEGFRYMLYAIASDDEAAIEDRLSRAEAIYEESNDVIASLEDGYTGDMSDIEAVKAGKAAIESAYATFKTYCEANDFDSAFAIYDSDILPVFTETIEPALENISNYSKEYALEQYNETENNTTSGTIIVAIFAAASIIVCLVFAVIITKNIVTGVNQVKDASNEMNKGNLAVEIPYESKDEVGQCAEGVRRMSATTVAIINDIKRVLGAFSQGDLTVDMESNKSLYVGDYTGIYSSFEAFRDKLNKVFVDIRESSKRVSEESSQVANSAQALSQGATQQSASVQQLSATINSLATDVRANASQAQEVSNQTAVVRDEIGDVNGIVQDLVDAMDEINKSSESTKNIIKSIEDIAFQTNILSLNAAIEAARAGQAGKGFAVVADEVRNLAAKSAESAKDTSALIEGTIEAINKGNSLVSSVADKVSNITVASEKVSEINEKISSDSKNAAESISQITIGVDQIADVIQLNAATSQQSAAASQELSGQAESLNDFVQEFNLREDDGEDDGEAV